MSNLLRAAVYTQAGLKHQEDAWDYLESLITPAEREEFFKRFRQSSAQTNVVVSVQNKVKLLSQRDIKGDNDGDKKPDAWQTCLITSATMAINAYSGSNHKPEVLDRELRTSFGSRYSHDNVVRLLARYKVKSVFSTGTTYDALKSHLKKGELTLLSTRITHLGHIFLVADYDETKKAYLVFDPYGEPFKSGSRWIYKDIRSPYWLSETSLRSVSMNGANASGCWAHLLSKM